MNGWIMPMFAAGTCSAGAIVLLRELPRFAPGMPALLTVSIYMLFGGVVLLAAASFGRAGTSSTVPWPQTNGLILIASIGILLGALEAFFVVGGRNAMPLPDAMIVYNLTSLALVTFAGIVMFGEAITVQRIAGLGLGLLSLVILLLPERNM
jgi:drug/metabolite transporter (DMT)-like permease